MGGNAPATVEGFETRPAAECGPIIVCLDTSGSMMGARETVAKCMTLECARQARTTNRPCFLYAFSGPGDCMELELKVSAKGLSDLLTFLEGSFHGGTDVDEPFERALARLDTEEWENADILLVTDGEIKPMQEDLLDAARRPQIRTRFESARISRRRTREPGGYRESVHAHAQF